jgi:hypothetical protein
MKAKLVFNDLSITPAKTESEAREWFTEMITAVADLIKKGICTTEINSNINLDDFLLTDDYGFIEWRYDDKVNRDTRLLASQLLTRKPVQASLQVFEKAFDDFKSSEFKLKEYSHIESIALGVALLHDGIAVSLPSKPLWCQSHIEIIQRLYDENLENPDETFFRIRQVSRPNHVDIVIRDWRRSLSQHIKSATELVVQWTSAFPNLDMCEEYEQKMLPHLHGTTLKSVLDKLWKLDETCELWKETKQEPTYYSMSANPESPGTMNIKELADMRLSSCPYQGLQHFKMHCRIQPRGFRLYWLVNSELYRITICYIGPHLPTKKYKGQ